MNYYNLQTALFFSVLSLLIWCCKDDDVVETESLQAFIEVDGDTVEILDGSTINIQEEDTICLIVQGGNISEGSSLGDYVVTTSSSNNLEISLSDEYGNIYYIIPSDVGAAKVVISDGGFDDENTYMLVSINVNNPVVNWSVTLDLNDTIVVDDSNVYDEIVEDLVYDYIYAPSNYTLEYLNTIYPCYGILTVIKRDSDNEQDTVSGTFIGQIEEEDTIFIMKYNDESHTYQFRKTAGKTTKATLTEDLTSEYQSIYTEVTIDQVLDVTTLSISEVNYDLVEYEE